MEQTYTPEQVAKALQVKVDTIYKWAKDGTITHIKVNDRMIRFRESDIEAYLNSKTIKGA